MKIKWYQFWKFNTALKEFEYRMASLSLKTPHSPHGDLLFELKRENSELKRKLNENI